MQLEFSKAYILNRVSIGEGKKRIAIYSQISNILPSLLVMEGNCDKRRKEKNSKSHVIFLCETFISEVTNNGAF